MFVIQVNKPLRMYCYVPDIGANSNKAPCRALEFTIGIGVAFALIAVLSLAGGLMR